MFSFDFDIDDADDEIDQPPRAPPAKEDTRGAIDLQPFCEIDIPQLLDSLPSLISYSPLRIPLSHNGSALTLLRRDLFDARFQLIAEAGDELVPKEVGDPSSSGQSLGKGGSALEFLEAPSDLVPGVYEGGLKTWECSLDLVQYLETLGFSEETFRGKRILEIGCGTAVPSLYLLHRLLAGLRPPDLGRTKTQLHLQDYNKSVLELVTFPNVLLTWYMSPAAAHYREAARKTEDDTPDDLQNFDPSVPSELSITPALKAAFLASLRDYDISVRFFSGSWDTFDVSSVGGRYDVVLTSETIYRPDSLTPLIGLMRAGSTCPSPQGAEQSLSLCLVAAKVMYFGVGGGVQEFVDAVTEPKHGEVQVVWESNIGVGRKVMRVEWVYNS